MTPHGMPAGCQGWLGAQHRTLASCQPPPGRTPLPTELPPTAAGFVLLRSLPSLCLPQHSLTCSRSKTPLHFAGENAAFVPKPSVCCCETLPSPRPCPLRAGAEPVSSRRLLPCSSWGARLSFEPCECTQLAGQVAQSRIKPRSGNRRPACDHSPLSVWVPAGTGLPVRNRGAEGGAPRLMPPGPGLCPCCSEPPVPRQTWQCQRVFSQLWVQNSWVGLVPNSHPSQQQTGSRASWRSAAFPSLLPMLAHTTSRSCLGKNPALWLPKSKPKTPGSCELFFPHTSSLAQRRGRFCPWASCPRSRSPLSPLPTLQALPGLWLLLAHRGRAPAPV